jgi:uncharacterized membrane protein YfcA
LLIYLPIAEISVNMFTIFGMGAAIGFLSGLFGVGGGFLLTPLLIFAGIPPVSAVASVAPQIVASSASGALAYWRRNLIDVKLAAVLSVAGIIGTGIGVVVFDLLVRIGQFDLIVALAYVLFLGTIGALMLSESVRAMMSARAGRAASLRRPGQHTWIHGLPLKMRFKRSRLYLSVIPLAMLGIGIGVLGTLLGIGGGFLIVPALIYILRVPSNVVIGTSLVQIVASMTVATVLHSVSSQSVDVTLAVILMIGGVIGAQFGARVGQNIRGDQLRALLGLLVLAVALRFLVGLVITPAQRYGTTLLSGGGL